LDRPDDFVLLEISAALKRGIRVVPILLPGAVMPKPEELPLEIEQLTRFMALGTTDQDFDRKIKQLVGSRKASPPAKGGTFRNSLTALLDRLLPSRRTRLESEDGYKGATSDWLGSASHVEETIHVPVLLGASAPETVRAGDRFTARFVAYVKALEEQVSEELSRLSPRATSRLGVVQISNWQPGVRVTIRLAAGALEVKPNEQIFEWAGKCNRVDFAVSVPNDAKASSEVLEFIALIDGIVVATLLLDLEIVASRAKSFFPLRWRSKSPMNSATTSAARTAFASYSSQDRQRVLDRVAAVSISAGLDVFLDCLSLHPGESWKPCLQEEIKIRDLFMLFWSAEAAQSEWVRWEWRTALTSKSKRAMQIHPLESGVKPPDELKDLHFGDVFMLVREMTELRATNRSA
jgi:hypothetical protein